jgi:hypothetical protein
MIVAGTRLYGKVDQVPGLFYLATEFVHVQFVPIGPTRSYLILEGADRGARIGLSGKSILFAYIRAFLVIVGGSVLAIGIIGGIHCLGDKAMRAEGLGMVLALFAVGGVCLLLFFLSYRLSRPSPLRAYRLAIAAKLPLDALAEHYAKTLTPEQLDNLARRVASTEANASADEWSH